jgi:hypothetical protein
MMRPICPNPKCGVEMPQNATSVFAFLGLAGNCILIHCRNCGVTLGVVPRPKQD